MEWGSEGSISISPFRRVFIELILAFGFSFLRAFASLMGFWTKEGVIPVTMTGLAWVGLGGGVELPVEVLVLFLGFPGGTSVNSVSVGVSMSERCLSLLT